MPRIWPSGHPRSPVPRQCDRQTPVCRSEPSAPAAGAFRRRIRPGNGQRVAISRLFSTRRRLPNGSQPLQPPRRSAQKLTVSLDMSANGSLRRRDCSGRRRARRNRQGQGGGVAMVDFCDVLCVVWVAAGGRRMSTVLIARRRCMDVRPPF